MGGLAGARDHQRMIDMFSGTEQPEIQQSLFRFILNPLWNEAGWRATTFRWHPQSEFPPIMGIVFANGDDGRRIFREFAQHHRHGDRFDELRISIIEGSLPGQMAGYSVHLCPDPESLFARATAEGIVLDPTVILLASRWNRMYPLPDSPPLLARFKEEYEKHREFLLAPVTRRPDGQDYFDVDCGIVNRRIQFRQLSEITSDDIDSAALKMPELVRP